MDKKTHGLILKSLSCIDQLHEETAAFGNSYNGPMPDSQAMQEFRSCPEPKFIKFTHELGGFAIESAAEHLAGVRKCYTEPAVAIAAVTCARGLLESAALSVWFFDPEIDDQERVKRGFAFRYEGLNQQSKSLRGKDDNAKIQKVHAQMDKIEQEAVRLNYAKVCNKNGTRIGVGMVMPGITDIIKEMLNGEFSYRLFSAIAHSHTWAVTQVGFHPMLGDDDAPTLTDLPEVPTTVMEKHFHPKLMLYFVHVSVTAYAKCVWCQSKLFGWNISQLEAIFERLFDEFQYSESVRFWRI